jgi:hypothetical protein
MEICKLNKQQINKLKQFLVYLRQRDQREQLLVYLRQREQRLCQFLTFCRLRVPT